MGVGHLMNASPAEVRAGMMRGLAEVEAEFAAFRSLVNAAAAEAGRPWWATAEVADEAYECMRYCLYEAAGSSPRIFVNSPYPRDCDSRGVRPERCVSGGHGMHLADFCQTPEAVTATLEIAHVAALRIYSTAAFKVLNGPLREPWAFDRNAAQPRHPFPVTISFLTDAIGKLRAVGAVQPNANVEFDLWRGVRDRAASEGFLGNGGTEQAPLSTTANLKVALSYSIGGAERAALLFKLRTNTFMGRGASLRFVSAFPDEDECLFPPLTYLKPTRKAPVTVTLGGENGAGAAGAAANGGRLVVTVIEVVPHLGGM